MKLISLPKGAFFSRQGREKGDDIKIKRNISPFFFLLPVYLSFIAILSLFFAVYMAWGRPKSLVKS